MDRIRLHTGNEKIATLNENLQINEALGVVLSCVSPENFQINLNEIKNLGMPFGFKLNGFIKTIYNILLILKTKNNLIMNLILIQEYF